jgi:DNA invertase Pin-like site-specific DNA recombinase
MTRGMTMNDFSKVRPSHTQRAAFVYIRQSSPAQVEYNRESTARQYALVEKACALGWAKEQVIVIDQDLGLSGSGSVQGSGFAHMTAEVALGHVGMVLGLEVSRLARNNADWYRWLDLCGITDTLIGDSDGVYHPAVQRSPRARIEGHYVGSRTAHPAGTTRGWNPQQSRAR